MLFKQYRFEVFTTPCELLLFTSSDKDADEAYNAIYSNAKRLEQTYSYYSEHSQLYGINHRDSNRCTISDEFHNLIQLSLFYTKITKGNFDIALAGTMKASCTSSDYSEYLNSIDRCRPYASSEHILLEENQILFSNEITQLDLGGLVKEYAVDQSVLILQNMGIQSALVNFGGDLAAFGDYHGEAWKIGIEDPLDFSKNIMQVDLINSSLCTSGHSKRFTQIESKIISHVHAPDNKKETETLQVTIIAPTTVDAGVWSTAYLADSTLELPAHITLVNRLALLKRSD